MHVIFEPLDFIAKLAALMPKPRTNLTRYHGALAPNSKHRIHVTPAMRGKGGARAQEPAVEKKKKPSADVHRDMTWAQHLKRVLALRWGVCASYTPSNICFIFREILCRFV